ncbi:MAG: hypothetical protein KKD36_09455, partial [Bacteroidetes bacterium]|nr:hypothetical protein [Bacteroidota bacterium]
MKCKNCEEKEAIKYSKYSAGEFCSRKCAHGFSTKEKRKEINERVSKTFKLKYPEKIKKCESCDTIISNKSKKRYCSKCFLFIKNVMLFKKLGIKEKNLQIANKKALEILTTEYFKNKKSLPEIYKEYDIRLNTVFLFFKKNNIKLRNYSKAQKNVIVQGK